MKIIKATTGEEIMVSDEDYSLLSRHRWHIKEGYPNTVLSGHRIKMHRLVIGIIPSGMITDHIDRNKLNNTRENLRPTSHWVNSLNSPQAEGLQSQSYVGIRKRNRNGRVFYEASSSVNGKDIYIGRGENEIEVAKMRDAFVYRTRGEFAYLNFPDNVPEYEVFEFKNKKLYQYF